MCKRVMRVMMVGLLAILGAAAEAHLIVKNGKGWVCSICVSAEASEENQGSVDPTKHIELLEYLVMIRRTELLCPNDVEDSKVPVNLVVRKQVEPSDITRVINQEGKLVGLARADVAARVSDLPLKEDLKCSDSSSAGDVLVRQAGVVINTYACDLTDPTVCSSVSSLSLGTCTLSGKFNLKEYPKNLPPIGTLYSCKVEK